MIVNMAVDNGGGVGNNHALSLLTSPAVNNHQQQQQQQEQCAYNFLKRKHESAAEENCNNTNQEINNQQQNLNENLTSTQQYQGSTELDINVWKKRHIEATTTAITLATMTTTTATSTNITATTTLNADTTINCFNFNNNQNETNNQLEIFGQSNQILINESNNNNNNIIVNNNHNNINHNSNDVTFNLITSSAFINDFFEYDAGLIVPVTVANTVNIINNNSNNNNQQLTTTNNNSNGNNNHIITSNIQPTNVYIDSDEWQSADLLELDHRYNSGLQTEISQLKPTINLSSSINALQPVVVAAEINSTISSNNSPQEQLQHSNFLVPQKQINQNQLSSSNSAHSLTKYRSVQNLTQLENVSQSQVQQKPENQDSDFEDKNLSWLLNFKFDDLPHLSPDISGNSANSNNAANSKTSNSAAVQNSTSNMNSLGSQRDRSCSPKTSASTKTGKKFEELVMEATAELDGNEMIVAENVVVEDTPLKTSLKKPPFTYTELIEYALEDKGELTVSGIYQWISDRFPYYKSNDDRWKNSVRHNLSINPHFRKGVKAPQGAGHLWTISSGDSAENVLAWEHKKQRLELFFKMESMNRERLQQHQQQQLQQQQQQQQHNEQCPSPHNHQGCQAGQCLYEETAKAAATISQEMLQQQQQQQSTTSQRTEAATTITHINNNNHTEQHHQRLPHAQIMHELPFNDLMSDEELRKTAGQILNGIHREVEVQSVNSIISTYHDVLLDNEDYLNPIQKDVALHESGLRHSNNTSHIISHPSSHHNHNSSQYYVTEIDPLELGIQMSHQVHEEEEVLFNDDFNLNYFAYNAGNDIVA